MVSRSTRRIEIVILKRRKTRQIRLGTVSVGGEAPVVVQSMCNTDTRDIQATLAQIRRLDEFGCELVRLAVLDEDAVRSLKEIKKEAATPLIADIHFDHRLALGALKAAKWIIEKPPGLYSMQDVLAKGT